MAFVLDVASTARQSDLVLAHALALALALVCALQVCSYCASRSILLDDPTSCIARSFSCETSRSDSPYQS
jgi:hypothetical protein